MYPNSIYFGLNRPKYILFGYVDPRWVDIELSALTVRASIFSLPQKRGVIVLKFWTVQERTKTRTYVLNPLKIGITSPQTLKPFRKDHHCDFLPSAGQVAGAAKILIGHGSSMAMKE